MLQLKSIAREAVPAALQKAERYRLINQPWAAESICLDALAVDPENQEGIITLLLAITDQFTDRSAGGVARAIQLLPRIHDEYKRAYYGGIISERRAKAQLDLGGPGANAIAYHCLHEAMGFYQQAEARRPPGDDEALLRWNTCLRLLERHPHLEPLPEERGDTVFGE